MKISPATATFLDGVMAHNRMYGGSLNSVTSRSGIVNIIKWWRSSRAIRKDIRLPNVFVLSGVSVKTGFEIARLSDKRALDYIYSAENL